MKFVLPVVCVHILLAAFLSATLSISSDESCSIATTRGNIAHVIHQSVEFEWQPPGYFLLLWIWRLTNTSIVWSRCLSVLCTAISIFVFHSVCRRLARDGASWPYWATIAFAFHPYTFFAATEMRLYALGLCLSIVQFDWFCRGYLDERKTGRWVYFIIATLSLYVNILLGLTLAAQNATLIFMQRWKEARQHFCSLVVVGVLFLPMFLLQLQNLQKKDTPAGEQSVLKAISFVIGSDAYHLGPVPRIDATLAFRAVLTITFVASFVWLVARNWRDVSVLQTTVWSYCLAITCLLIVFVIVAKLLPNPRYTFPLLLATLVAWGKVTEFIRRESVVGVVWSLTLAMCFWTLADTYRPLCKSGDWIRVKNFLQSHEEKNQPIVVFISEVDTILRNYYRGPNSIVPVPGPQRMDRFLYADFDIASAEAVRELLHPVLQNCNECWLVTYDGGILISPHQYHREFLDKYLQENFDAEVRTEFFDSSVTRLRRRIVIEKL